MNFEFCAKLKAALNDAAFDDICVLTHSNPDGDAVSSACALVHLLKHFGKNAAFYFSDKNEPAEKFGYIDTFTDDKNAVDPRFIITVDVTGFDRISGIPECFADEEDAEKHVAFVIDHHEVSNIRCPDRWIEPGKCAAAEMVYDIYKYLGVEFDEYSARAMYTGILTDTGCFRYSNTTPSSLNAVSELMTYIPSPLRRTIIDVNFEKKSMVQVCAEADLIKRAVFAEDGKLAFAVYDENRMNELHITKDMFGGFSSVLRCIEGVKAAFAFRPDGENRYKISARSDYDGISGIDVSEVCSHFGGGGHKAAAGCTVTDDPEKVIGILTELCRKYF